MVVKEIKTNNIKQQVQFLGEEREKKKKKPQ